MIAAAAPAKVNRAYREVSGPRNGPTGSIFRGGGALAGMDCTFSFGTGLNVVPKSLLLIAEHRDLVWPPQTASFVSWLGSMSPHRVKWAHG
jgi:hypothetical protein